MRYIQERGNRKRCGEARRAQLRQVHPFGFPGCTRAPHLGDSWGSIPYQKLETCWHGVGPGPGVVPGRMTTHGGCILVSSR